MQLDEAINFLKEVLKTRGGESEITVEEFEKACGVGIVVTDEDLNQAINKLFEENKEQILSQGHDF